MIEKYFEENNVTIARNILYDTKRKKHPAYISKHNSDRGKEVILLMILHGEKLCHFLSVKKLSLLLRGNRLNITVIFIV